MEIPRPSFLARAEGPQVCRCRRLYLDSLPERLEEECLQTVTLYTQHRQRNVPFRVSEDLFSDTLAFYIYNTLTRSDNLPN